MRALWLAAFAATGLASPATAQVFSPVPVMGFTRDVIADASGFGPPLSVTAGFHSHFTNSQDAFGFALYQQGFNAAFPARGVPADGSVVTSPTRSYQLGPASGNNSLQLYNYGAGQPVNLTGTLALVTPARYASLSLLLADGLGRQPSQGGYPGTLTVNWSNGNAAAYPYTTYDWFLVSGTPGPNSGVAIGALDRIFFGQNYSYSIDNNTTDPRLFYYDFDLSADPNYLAEALVTSVTATRGPLVPAGTVTNIMGLSGAVTVPEPSTLLLAANGAAVLFATCSRKPR